MSDLFWPGDERAGALLSDAELLRAMESVEAAWLEALVAAGIAPAEARNPVRGLVGPDDVAAVAQAAEAGGNPVIPLVGLLRDRLPGESARWLHRGLTSQDVLDTALVLLLRDVLDRLDTELHRQVGELLRLTTTYAEVAEVGRTLTQHAVPITFGLKTAGWLTGVLDAADALGAGAYGSGRAAGRRRRHLGGHGRAGPAAGSARADRGGLAAGRGDGVDPGSVGAGAVAHRPRSADRRSPTPWSPAPTRTGTWPPTSPRCRDPRSASSPRAPVEGPRPCRTSAIRPCRC